jgi:hypothetical protein
MPELDVSFVLFDPLLCDTFDVTRRLDVIDQHGRSNPTPEQFFPDVMGVVTQESPSDLLREPDLQRVPRSIFVASEFAFRGASTSHQPDVISWCGTDYTVTSVLPYGRYGEGFYEVIAKSTVAIDDPQ